MKKQNIFFLLPVILLGTYFTASAQDIDERRERRKGLTVKEWNTESNRKWLDHYTVYNEDGYKIEEIEYAVYGQKERVVSEFNAEGKCIKETVYDYKNKPYRIRKYEHNEDGTKKKQYNYLPNGKLFSVKTYEYIKR